MKVLVIDASGDKRADLVDALCELPNIEVRGAVANVAEASWRLASDRLDAIVVGNVRSDERPTLDALAEFQTCTVIDVSEDLVETLTQLGAERRSRSTYAELASRSKGVMETIVLDEWLPRVVNRIRPLLSPLVEIVVMVEHGTQPVRCVPEVLEHVVLDLVVEACRSIPWGGIVWLTATPAGDGEVKLDVLENGVGHVRDLTLLASPSPLP